MGKRKRSGLQTVAIKNKLKNLEEYETTESEFTSSHSSTQKKKKKSKKINKDTAKNKNFDVEFEESNSQAAQSTDKTIKKVNLCVNREVTGKCKKIVFVNDQPVDVSFQKNISEEIDEKDFSHEDDVRDEDIDKFCDEIDEKDNIQYLNWIEQIEAKLCGNKKKAK